GERRGDELDRDEKDASEHLPLLRRQGDQYRSTICRRAAASPAAARGHPIPAADSSQFVITRPFGNSGLGSNLLSMAGALYACERSGRHLIVDWTGMSELRD